MDGLKVSAFLAVSMDGYLAGQGEDLTWLERHSGDSPESTGYAALMASADLLLLGRRTYDVVREFGHWPYAGKEVRVLTHRPLTPLCDERPCQGPIEAVLAALQREGARHIYLDGGESVRQGLAAGRVTEMTLHVVPEILGGGRRLFQDGLPPSAWRLVKGVALPSGLVQLVYQPL